MKERFNHNWHDYARSIGYDSERDMLTDMYVTQRISLSEIAERLQCGVFTVTRHLNALDVVRRKRGGPNLQAVQSRKLFYIDQRLIHKMPNTRLARLLGMSASLVYKYVKLITREEATCNSVSSVPSPDSNAIAP